MRLYYAQNREDLFIGAFFPDVEKGFYVDVGANDPELDSVTKLFYDRGWSGINVEPIPRHHKALQQQRPRDINVRVGLSDKPGKLKFREYTDGDGLSTFDTTMTRHYEQNQTVSAKNHKDYEVPVTTLSKVLEENNVEHINFAKIDVEGYEYEVIKGNDWAKYRPELLCIEANHINKDWRPLLKDANYRLVFFDGINEYYLANESLYRKDYFDYPLTTLAGNPVYYRTFLEVDYEAQAKARELTNIVTDREHQILQLQKQQRNIKFLAKRLFEEVQLRINKRAMRSKSTPRLSYDHDSSISQKLTKPEATKMEALKFIRGRDAANIRRTSPAKTRIISTAFWKFAAGTFNAAYLIAKKAARRIR